jgi:putative transposase
MMKLLGTINQSSLNQRLMGTETIYFKPHTTHRHPGDKLYSFLLKGVDIKQLNQVRAADIT